MMGFLAGITCGVITGLLVAPAPGEETRRRIAEKLDRSAREKAREIGARAGEKAYDELKGKVVND